MGRLKHVYILGAGFSAPLGGPLFCDLLDERNVFKDRFQYGNEDSEDAVVYKRIPTGLKFLREHFPISNSEQWMEAIASVNQAPNSRLTTQIVAQLALGRYTGRDLTNLSARLTRLVRLRLALETTQFLHEIRDDSERWIPFENWFRLLDENDTIITFNYDNAVERIAEKVERPFLLRDNVSPRSRPRSPELIKLHESVDVFVDGQDGDTLRFQSHFNKEEYCEFLLLHEVLLGTPGSRARLRNKH